MYVRTDLLQSEQLKVWSVEIKPQQSLLSDLWLVLFCRKMERTPLRGSPTLPLLWGACAGLVRPTRCAGVKWASPTASAACAPRWGGWGAPGRWWARRTACSSTCGRPRCSRTPSWPSWSGSTEGTSRCWVERSRGTPPVRGSLLTLTWFTSASTTGSAPLDSWRWRCWEKVLETPQVSGWQLNMCEGAVSVLTDGVVQGRLQKAAGEWLTWMLGQEQEAGHQACRHGRSSPISLLQSQTQ